MVASKPFPGAAPALQFEARATIFLRVAPSAGSAARQADAASTINRPRATQRMSPPVPVEPRCMQSRSLDKPQGKQVGLTHHHTKPTWLVCQGPHVGILLPADRA